MSKIPSPPRGELFADPAAAVVFAAIEKLEPGAQHQVLDALRERLATPGFAGESGPQVRERRAVGALREAAQIIGHSPSVAEFEDLRLARRELGWPPQTTIRRTIGAGSWNTALRRARLDAVPDGDALVVELGPQFTADEALDAIRACAGPLGRIPTLGEYLAWAKDHTRTNPHLRLPCSQGPFDRLFGGWQRAVATLQEADNGSNTDTGAVGLIRKSGARRWTEDELIGFLKKAAARLGRPPTTTDLPHLRERMIAEARAAGHEPLIPSYPALRRLGASWDDVLVAAGLAPRGGRTVRSNPRTRPNRRRYREDQITQTLVEAYGAVGDPFTGEAFRRWRTEAIAALGDPYARIPGYEIIVARTGGWDNARRIARETQP